MTRLVCLTLAVTLVAVFLPASGGAGARMLVGFQDDASFRFRPDRKQIFDDAVQVDASVVRSTIEWSKVAPARPVNAANPFDPAYRLDDIDEFVRNATIRGIQPMLQVWGTPSWANGGSGRNRVPKRLADLTNFCRAISARYSGRYPGFPYVGYWAVWNEPNLAQFLSPQFAGPKKKKDVGPALYARLFSACYTGIKAGNRNARVGLGETSARGRDRHRAGIQDTHSPGRFAQLLAKAAPRLKFDAYAHHPYPTVPSQPPTQKVRFPNVGLAQLPVFETNLKKWFHRKSVPIWITEYGHETIPDAHGISYSKQAAYTRKALSMARGFPYVSMFIWFVLHDDQGDPWQSGLIAQNGTKKPAYSVFTAAARLVDARNPIVTVKGGRPNPVVSVSAVEIAGRSGPGTAVGFTERVYEKGKLVDVSQPRANVSIAGTVAVPIAFTPVARHTYTVTLDGGDVHGNKIFRTITLIAT